MRLRSLLGVMTALVLCAASAGATSPELQVYLDHRPLALSVPARLENGRTMVPLRSLAEALGAQVSYVETGNGTAVVHVTSYPMRFSPPVGQGTVRSMRSSPADPQALGASVALTQYLATEQAASLTGGGPALVRFELTDLESSCYFPPPTDLADFCAYGFHFAVRLYYTKFEASSVPLGVAAYERVTESGSIGVGGVTRAPQSSWYEDVTLWVHPVGKPRITTGEGREVVEHGTAGWAVDPASRTSLQRVNLDRSPYLIHGSFGR